MLVKGSALKLGQVHGDRLNNTRLLAEEAIVVEMSLGDVNEPAFLGRQLSPRFARVGRENFILEVPGQVLNADGVDPRFCMISLCRVGMPSDTYLQEP